jgi:hypothetical protein
MINNRASIRLLLGLLLASGAFALSGCISNSPTPAPSSTTTESTTSQPAAVTVAPPVATTTTTQTTQ